MRLGQLSSDSFSSRVLNVKTPPLLLTSIAREIQLSHGVRTPQKCYELFSSSSYVSIHDGSKNHPLQKSIELEKRRADEEGLEISSFDISETIDRIVEIASEMPVTIFIDALDECRPGQRHELLNALDILLDRSAHLVKVFVSSRDDIDIVLSLQKHPNIYINTNDNKDDIERFIKYEIQKAQSDRRLLKGTASPRLTSLITDHLTVKAGGM